MQRAELKIFAGSSRDFILTAAVRKKLQAALLSSGAVIVPGRGIDGNDRKH
ncbi:hypothetical protein [Succinimonas amylolytica]|uniref:hypothetical protein n=1 Tax=Succinimonas amylolytica TaxID=83769 RepID=UPI00036BD659|nr:hypothetical protein [Succinimonas amylolytica]